MIKKTFLSSVLAIAPFFAGTAFAQSIEEAIQAFNDGRFLEAAELAAGQGTSEGYVWASRSLTIYGHYIAPTLEERQGILLRAIQLAKKAVELDESNPYAYQAMAHSEGRYAESLPTIEALSAGYAEKTLASMQRAVELDPDFAYAHVAIGGWHARIINAAGFMGALIYGASEDKAHEHYERAIALLPDDIIILANYAIGLLQLDEDDNRAQVQELLARIEATPNKNTYEQILQEEVAKHLEALGAG